MEQKAVGSFLKELRREKGITQEQLAEIAGFILYMVLEIMGLADEGATEMIASVGLGFAAGMLVVGAIFTSRYAARIRAFKMRLLKRTQ